MTTPDPFDYLRRAPEPTASPEGEALARRRLDDVIADEANRQARGRVRRRLLVASSAIGGGLAAAGLVRRLGITRAVGQISEGIRGSEQSEIPEGAFAYFQSQRTDLVIRPGDDFGIGEREYVAYLQPSTREVWRSHDMKFLQVTTSLLEPVPLDQSLVGAVRGVIAPNVGKPRTERFLDVEDPLLQTEWPDDAAPQTGHGAISHRAIRRPTPRH